MTDADQKAAIRERMASTGENYTTAKRAIELARLKAQSEQLDSTLAEQRTRIRTNDSTRLPGNWVAISHQPSGWPGCMRWRAWLMTGRTTGRCVSTCCAPTCACAWT